MSQDQKQTTATQSTGQLIFVAAVGGSMATISPFLIARLFEEYDSQLLATIISSIAGLVVLVVTATKLFNIFFMKNGQPLNHPTRGVFGRLAIMFFVSLASALLVSVAVERLIAFAAG